MANAGRGGRLVLLPFPWRAAAVRQTARPAQPTRCAAPPSPSPLPPPSLPASSRLEQLPLYGMGVSSGASFLLKMPRFLPVGGGRCHCGRFQWQAEWGGRVWQGTVSRGRESHVVLPLHPHHALLVIGAWVRWGQRPLRRRQRVHHQGAAWGSAERRCLTTTAALCQPHACLPAAVQRRRRRGAGGGAGCLGAGEGPRG